MIKFMLQNKENILAVISISAFLISSVQLIHSLVKRRINLAITLHNTQQIADESNQSITLTLLFFNNSSLPISINCIYIMDNQKNEYCCALKHEWIGERYYPKFPETDIPITERVFTPDFPIHLIPRSGKIEKIRFNVNNNLPKFRMNDVIMIKIATDRKDKKYQLVCTSFKETL